MNAAELVPAIYNYCDRCCHRCRFTERCRSELEARAPAGSRQGAADMMRLIAERHGIELAIAQDDDPDVERAVDDRIGRARADPLVAQAEEYAMLSWPIVRVLQPIVARRGDQAAIEATGRIEELSAAVASKIFRAVSGTHEPAYDPALRQSDVNGSAKIARLIVADSRAAWHVLMETGRAAADGVPARLVRLLDDIDAGLAARFPHAMDFARPGFDTGADGGPAASDQHLANHASPRAGSSACRS